MKTILFALLIVLAACSTDNDPEPQLSCEQLNAEIAQVSAQITEHYNKGSQGNQSAWEKELRRLMDIKQKKTHEANNRLCHIKKG